MIFFIALGVSLTGAAALLLHQYRSRALAAGEAPAPAPDAADNPTEERQAA